MKDFFKMMFASTLGVILASFILIILSILVFTGIIASASSAPGYSLEKQTIMKIELNGSISEREKTDPWEMVMGNSNKNVGLNDILNAIKKAKENEKIEGIYIKIAGPSTLFATSEPIRKALIDFKESGKFIVAYGDFYDQNNYYIASVADKVFMNPQGVFVFNGLASQPQFIRGSIEKMGLKVQVFKVGTYKSFVEPFIQDKMSDANRLQVTSYLNDIWGHMLAGISESRKIPVDKLNAYADELIALSDPKLAVDYGLVDELTYTDQVENYLKEQVKIDQKDDLKMASVSNLKSIPFLDTKINNDKIAILYAEGEIVGDEMENTPFSSGTNITAKQFVSELNKLKEDENIKAVVFRVNSPGGSAFASEQIWHAVKELKAVKPIVVSMGEYAASGGYYISCGATKIVAEPTTLTGSIGIFGIFPSGEELAKRLGTSYDVVATNKHADFGGTAISIPILGIPIFPNRPLNDEEQILLQSYIERGYDIFLSRCAEGRSKTKAEIDSIGQGRVWTGSQALQIGLIDKIGGVEDAVKLAAEAAGIENYSLSDYPVQKDFFTQLMEESFGGMQMYMMKQFFGLEKFEQKSLIKALEHYDYRQAIIPYAIKN